HRLDEREEYVLGVYLLGQLLGAGQEELAERRVGQQRLGEVPAGPPPDGPETEALRRRLVLRPARRHVARHAERHRHIEEYLVTADAVVETPRLVLVPRIHRPFPRAEIVIGEIVVEVTI